MKNPFCVSHHYVFRVYKGASFHFWGSRHLEHTCYVHSTGNKRTSLLILSWNVFPIYCVLRIDLSTNRSEKKKVSIVTVRICYLIKTKSIIWPWIYRARLTFRCVVYVSFTIDVIANKYFILYFHMIYACRRI